MYDQDRSSDMAPEWLTANVALLDHLGVPQAPRVRSLRRQLDSRRPGVAVIGLFSRGKSTLFNWLVGSDVSPVGALPTTAVLIEASLGERSAAAHSPWDIQMLPFEPDAFCRAVSGFQDPRPHRAELHGAFRLPPGLLLVDTPGVDAASDLSEQEWYEAAAGAALVVLSLPPGPSAADAELVRQAVAVYGPNVQVVLKSTSSDISQADLREVREVAELQLGIPVLALPDAPPTGAWGDVSSPWLVVESRLLELQAASSSSGAGVLDELAQWIVGALDSIEVAKLAEPDVVRCRDLAGSDRSMPFEVSEALMRLSTRAQQRIDAEAKAREAARVDHARRANERRVTGEALVDRLHAAIAVPEIPLGPDRNNAWALLDRSSRWMVGRGEYGEAGRSEELIERAIPLLRKRLFAVDAASIEDQVRTLFSDPVEDRAEWSAAYVDCRGRSQRWLMAAPQMPELADQRAWLQHWLAATAVAGAAWAEASNLAVLQAQSRVQARRLVGNLLWIGAVILLLVSLPMACSGALYSISEQPVQSYAPYRSSPQHQGNAGDSLLVLGGLLCFVSPLIIIVGVLVRSGTGDADGWRKGYRPPAPPLRW